MTATYILGDASRLPLADVGVILQLIVGELSQDLAALSSHLSVR